MTGTAHRLNEKTGYLNNEKGEDVLGITQRDYKNPFKLRNGNLGYRSTIRIAPRAFESAGKLYLTIGHELTHAFQNYYGLAYQWKFRKATMEYHVTRVWDMPALRSLGVSEAKINSYFWLMLQRYYNF